MISHVTLLVAAHVAADVAKFGALVRWSCRRVGLHVLQLLFLQVLLRLLLRLLSLFGLGLHGGCCTYSFAQVLPRFLEDVSLNM
jgi:hypothetical protein